MRIIHLSDIHVWRYAFNPLRLLNKRAVGMAEPGAGPGAEVPARAARRRCVERVRGLDPDHVLITGDLTTTALPDEFRGARRRSAICGLDAARVTVIPGNHDRYTTGSVRHRQFEDWFGDFAPAGDYPWLRQIGAETAILGLDATRSHLSATGWLPPDAARAGPGAGRRPGERPRRLIVACHYPVAAPPAYAHELAPKRMKNAADARRLAGGDRPAPLLLRPRPRRLGLRSPGRPRPALPERGRPLAPRPDRPPPARLPRDHAPRRGRDRDPSRLGRRRLDGAAALPGAEVFRRRIAVPDELTCLASSSASGVPAAHSASFKPPACSRG